MHGESVRCCKGLVGQKAERGRGRGGEGEDGEQKQSKKQKRKGRDHITSFFFLSFFPHPSVFSFLRASALP